MPSVRTGWCDPPSLCPGQECCCRLARNQRYTTERWGDAQRRSYVQQLEQAATELALGQGVFKDLTAVLPGLRMKVAGSHYIFCLPRPGHAALILGILHERMDLIARLKHRLHGEHGDHGGLG